MLTLLLLLVVIWLGLIGLLVLWTLFFQGYVYTQPVQGIVWRAPAAGTGVALFLFAWVFMDYAWPRNYRTLLDFELRSRDDREFDEFRAVDQFGEKTYKKVKNEKGQEIYRENGKRDGGEPMTRPQRVIVKEKNGEEVVFEPDRDAKGQFKTTKVSRFSDARLPLQYRDKKKRVMQEGQLGRVTGSFSLGNLILILLLNFLHLVVWFAVLWLVLEFRLWHAVGMAMVAWVALTIFLLPPTLTKAEEVADKRAPVKTGLLGPGSFSPEGEGRGEKERLPSAAGYSCVGPCRFRPASRAISSRAAPVSPRTLSWYIG